MDYVGVEFEIPVGFEGLSLRIIIQAGRCDLRAGARYRLTDDRVHGGCMASHTHDLARLRPLDAVCCCRLATRVPAHRVVLQLGSTAERLNVSVSVRAICR